jgi:hypothetical protein
VQCEHKDAGLLIRSSLQPPKGNIVYESCSSPPFPLEATELAKVPPKQLNPNTAALTEPRPSSRCRSIQRESHTVNHDLHQLILSPSQLLDAESFCRAPAWWCEATDWTRPSKRIRTIVAEESAFPLSTPTYYRCQQYCCCCKCSERQ